MGVTFCGVVGVMFCGVAMVGPRVHVGGLLGRKRVLAGGGGGDGGGIVSSLVVRASSTGSLTKCAPPKFRP
jgi:hypothetical protein